MPKLKLFELDIRLKQVFYWFFIAQKFEFTSNLDTYLELKNKLRLNVETLLNYMAIRVIGSSKNDVYINMKSPAQVKYFFCDTFLSY